MLFLFCRSSHVVAVSMAHVFLLLSFDSKHIPSLICCHFALLPRTVSDALKTELTRTTRFNSFSPNDYSKTRKEKQHKNKARCVLWQIHMDISRNEARWLLSSMYDIIFVVVFHPHSLTSNSLYGLSARDIFREIKSGSHVWYIQLYTCLHGIRVRCAHMRLDQRLSLHDLSIQWPF